MKSFKHIFLVASLIFSFQILSSETDQFLTWKADLNDSAPAYNKLMKKKLESVLKKTSKKIKKFTIKSCRKISVKFMESLKDSPSLKRITKLEYQSKHPGKYSVDIYPRKHTSIKEYYLDSIHNKQAATKLKELARSIQVGGVTFGNDKMTHFVVVGLSYYLKYLSRRKQGNSHEKALKYSMWRGFQKEATILGLKWGTFSFADLEANYQGFLLAYNLCESSDPHIKVVDNKWTIVKPIEITKYFTPGFDESYNRNYFRPNKLKKVESIINDHDYCNEIKSNKIQTRFSSYKLRSHDLTAMKYSKKLLNIAIDAEAAYPGLSLSKRYFPLTLEAQTFDKICNNQIDYSLKPRTSTISNTNIVITSCPTKQAGFKLRGRILSKKTRDITAAITNFISYSENYCSKLGKNDFISNTSFKWIKQTEAPRSIPFDSYYIKTCLQGKIKCI